MAFVLSISVAAWSQ